MYVTFVERRGSGIYARNDKKQIDGKRWERQLLSCSDSDSHWPCKANVIWHRYLSDALTEFLCAPVISSYQIHSVCYTHSFNFAPDSVSKSKTWSRMGHQRHHLNKHLYVYETQLWIEITRCRRRGKKLARVRSAGNARSKRQLALPWVDLEASYRPAPPSG